MAYNCLNLELIKEERTSLYDWYMAKYNDLEVKLCLEHSNLAGENNPSMSVSILIRGHNIYNIDYRFISTTSIQHNLDEITHMFKMLNQILDEIKI